MLYKNVSALVIEEIFIPSKSYIPKEKRLDGFRRAGSVLGLSFKSFPSIRPVINIDNIRIPRSNGGTK